MAPVAEEDTSVASVPAQPGKAVIPPRPPKMFEHTKKDVDEWTTHVDDVSAQIQNILDGTITDFDAFDRQMDLKARAKQIREEEAEARREKFYLNGLEGKGAGTKYKWWCQRCFVEYLIDLPGNVCTRCQQSDKMMTQAARREELMGKVETFKEDNAKHKWRKDKWLRWKKSQALLKRSRNINYKAWEFWEPDTDSENEGDPILPRDNPEFLAMEADMQDRKKKSNERAKTANKCRQRGNQCMKEGDFVGAIEHYEEGLEYNRSSKELWTNKALAEMKVFRWHDAVASCNKVIEYSEIFEDGFKKSADSCFKAFVRRASALRALHRWSEALADLDDALQLFPKDKEARELHAKTEAAAEEERRAKELRHGQDTPAMIPAAADKTSAAQQGPVIEEVVDEEPEYPRKAPAPSPHAAPVVTAGPVRVAIEESDSEEERADGKKLETSPSVIAPAHAGSLARLGGQAFSALLAKLEREETDRVLFCARGESESLAPKKKPEWDSRKVELSVEEVVEPSGLDGVIRDAERCCLLWKKTQGNVVPLRNDVKVLGADDGPTPEDRANAAYLEVCAPRVLAVLRALAAGSAHHCALTAPAVRNVWPLLACDTWRHAVLELLMEWSQVSISGHAMAEFASRYPEPHLRLLVEAVTSESRESALPPGFENIAKAATQKLNEGASLDGAMQDMWQGLSVKSSLEIAVSAAGNLCLAGHTLPAFREMAVPFCDKLVDALARHLRPLNWRLCGRAAGALCNVLRLGDVFAAAVHEKCAKPLVDALREERAPDSEMAMLRQICEGISGRTGEAHASEDLAMQCSTPQLLAALVNLLAVRPAAAKTLLEMGALALAVPLLDPESEGEAAGDEVPGRAAMLASRLLTADPASLTALVETDLLRRLARILELRAPRSSDALPPAAALEQLDRVVRMLTVVLTKTPGAFDRLTSRAPRVQELPDDGDAPGIVEPAVDFHRLTARLQDLVISLQLRECVPVDEEGSTPSKLRGNVALLIGFLSEQQARDDAPPVLRELDLAPLVGVLVECLRKERGAVQHNLGVCVTKLAQNLRYRQRVRDWNGLESLHQIQLPRVQAQKTEAEKNHRFETSAEDRKREARRRLELRAAMQGMD